MKHSQLFAAGCLAMLTAFGTNSLAVPASGQNNRLEWSPRQNWPIAVKTLDMVHSLDGKFVYILSDKQTVEVFNSQGQLQGSIPVEEGVTAIDIAPQGETLYLINDTTQTFSAIGVSFVVDVNTSGSPFKGPVDAPVTIALFTDFE